MFGLTRRNRRSSDPLDDVLFRWPDGTPFTVRDMLRSVESKGITGSGKSSGSGRLIVNALIRHPRSSLLIIAQKPEEREIYRRMFEEAGRELLIFEE